MNREQGVSKSAEKTKKKNGRIASPKITANIFLCFPPRNHLIFQAKLLVCPGQTKQFYMEEVVQMGTPILYLLVTFCFVSVRFWEAK